MRGALKITGLALKYIKRHIKPGRTELEVAGELERFIRYKGANSAAFEIIVASGANSSFPHHAPGLRRIRKNEPVLMRTGNEMLSVIHHLSNVFQFNAK